MRPWHFFPLLFLPIYSIAFAPAQNQSVNSGRKAICYVDFDQIIPNPE